MHTIQVFYRPDDYPEWIPWREFTQKFDIIGKAGSLDIGGVPTARAGFAPRIPFGKPAYACDPTSGRSLRRGFEFNVKFKGTGYCCFNRFRIHGMKLIEKATSGC
jgi:hypothetical protein